MNCTGYSCGMAIEHLFRGMEAQVSGIVIRQLANLDILLQSISGMETKHVLEHSLPQADWV